MHPTLTFSKLHSYSTKLDFCEAYCGRRKNDSPNCLRKVDFFEWKRVTFWTKNTQNSSTISLEKTTKKPFNKKHTLAILLVSFLGRWKRDPFKAESWPPMIRDKKVTLTLNHHQYHLSFFCHLLHSFFSPRFLVDCLKDRALGDCINHHVLHPALWESLHSADFHAAIISSKLSWGSLLGESAPRYRKWLGSPLFINHEGWSFGRGPTALGPRAQQRSPWANSTHIQVDLRCWSRASTRKMGKNHRVPKSPVISRNPELHL